MELLSLCDGHGDGAEGFVCVYCRTADAEVCGGFGSASNPVSYTHLDVYKRQIPDSVTWIGDEAFYRATDLQEIKLPKNLTELGWRAFGFCASLKEITIPKGVKKLPQYIFASCSGISVRFEENSQLNTICDRSITSGVYYMPEGIQYIFDDLDGTVLVTSMNKLRAVKSSWSVRVLVPTYADVGLSLIHI